MIHKLDDPSIVELSVKIMVIAIIFFFLVLLFVFFLHLYSKWFGYNQENQETLESTPIGLPSSGGLEKSILKSIPPINFSLQNFKTGIECIICITEILDGEKTRVLPKCNHGFHMECIDMWFHSHSTCPICRDPVSNLHDSGKNNDGSDHVHVLHNFPTNVLFCGNETQVRVLGSFCEENSSSSSQEGGLVIDIPREMVEDENQKIAEMPTRLRALKRLLSRDRGVNSCSSSSSNVDVEQVAR